MCFGYVFYMFWTWCVRCFWSVFGNVFTCNMCWDMFCVSFWHVLYHAVCVFWMSVGYLFWIPFWMSARSTELDLEGCGPWKCDRGSLYKVQTGLENVGKMSCKFKVFSKAHCMNPPTVWGLRWGNFGLTLDWVGFWFCTTLNFVEAQYHVGTTRFGLAPNTMLEFTGGSRN